MSHFTDIAAIRQDYQLAVLDETAAGYDPISFFRRWFAEAHTAEVPEVNAMALATSDAENRPHARMVLLKGLDEQGFVFFTNYTSDKGNHLDENPYAALVFFWKELERQVRVEGTVRKVTPEESDEYFHSRPLGSRIGAMASSQSRPVTDRSQLEKNYAEVEKAYAGGDIPRPVNWGGYRVYPSRIEFWQGRSSRLHDRILFVKQGETWVRSRLAP